MPRSQRNGVGKTMTMAAAVTSMAAAVAEKMADVVMIGADVMTTAVAGMITVAWLGCNSFPCPPPSLRLGAVLLPHLPSAAVPPHTT